RNSLTRRDLGAMFGPRSVSIGSRALGGSSTDDDGWGQWFNSVPGDHRAPRTAHLSGVVPARRRCARRLPGPFPSSGPVRFTAGRAAEPRAAGPDPPAAAAVGAHARAGAGPAVGERLSAEPARCVSGWGVGGWGVVGCGVAGWSVGAVRHPGPGIAAGGSESPGRRYGPDPDAGRLHTEPGVRGGRVPALDHAVPAAALRAGAARLQARRGRSAGLDPHG